ncbi:RNA binding protein [Giardia lamblia P15]|uniref:Protein MAK16 homolog n=1 Tax=Giardia intestinalis (strain P15) TaxID=658858 RepID=E1F5G6_GIAIA|nr:RNA binding protein [Giardia lamblia P15]
MSADGIVWECINRGFCSFKIKTDRTIFCTNKYNITGICERKFCPLANSQYATVLDINGHIVLHMKVIERAHLPSEQWEMVELSQDYKLAVKQLHKNLKYWPVHIRDKCRLRLKKIKEMHIRMHRLEKTIEPRLVHIKKKAERRDMLRQAKALAAAQIEKTIQKELLTQLKEGKYDEIYNFSTLAYKSLVTETAGKKPVKFHEDEESEGRTRKEREVSTEEEYEYEKQEREPVRAAA